MTIDVLGTKYAIVKSTCKADSILETADGYCDRSSKRIIVIDINDKNCSFEISDPEWYYRKVLRHEIIHAFMFESGIAECFQWKTDDIHNEAIVDWVAIQAPKIIKAWRKAGCLED